MSLSAVTAEPARSDTPRSDTPRSDTLRSVTSALDVLDCFSRDAELGVSDIARRLGIAKSTAHRLLTTLCSRGLTEKNPQTGQYRLGLHLFELGQLAQQRLRLREVALPLLEELRQVTGHTVHLGVLDGADVVYAERLETAECRRIMATVPRRFPSHCTSSGKVIAAFNPALLEARLELGFPPKTVGTIRSAQAYQAAVRQTAKAGVGITHGEAVSGLSSVAAPIRDLGGRAYAAVSIVAPTTRMLAEVDRTARLVSTVGRRISSRLAMAS
ncbi:MAG: IclR family transcriptional regulator [Actinobacteria bacterium]|nr:IclR family transcriptional regulator [Actinomycetota bacterium]